MSSNLIPILGPLDEYQQAHVPERRRHEDDHRNELTKEVYVVTEIEGVGALEHDTETHLQHSKDHTELHLEGVEEVKFIGGYVPLGIETYGVDAPFDPLGL